MSNKKTNILGNTDNHQRIEHLVSIIIPCRNEEKYISSCLDSVINQDFLKENLEVLVVDGMSEDKTKLIIEEYSVQYDFIKLLENPRKIIPTAMNIGIQNARGSIVMKIDAHTIYESNYISKCIRYLKDYEADNVGGLQIAIPRGNTLTGRSIVQALSHPFGVGNARHRFLSDQKPLWADTTYSGCFRKEIFNHIGLYDENIARSEDIAINTRLKKFGGKILLVPEIKTYYFARSNLKEYITHNFDNGFWITYPLKFGRWISSRRHLIPLIFTSSLLSLGILSFFSKLFLDLFLLIFVSYFILNLYSSLQISLKQGNFRYLFTMPIIFFLLHFFYGLGSIWGFIKVIFSRSFWNQLARGHEFS
jgi:glycosyltransferase involved in cell wall biosynthesis